MTSRRKLRERIRTLELEKVVGRDPITYRTLSVDFDERAFRFDGGGWQKIGARFVEIPILSTETPLIPRLIPRDRD